MQINLFDPVRSQAIIGLFSLLLILLSIASGIAFCCLIGIQIHSATIAVSFIIFFYLQYLCIVCKFYRIIHNIIY